MAKIVRRIVGSDKPSPKSQAHPALRGQKPLSPVVKRRPKGK
jgi:hypothetical protein